MLSSDGIQFIGVPLLSRRLFFLRSLLLVGIDGIRHINAHDARLHFRSVRLRVLTASGSSVSSVRARETLLLGPSAGTKLVGSLVQSVALCSVLTLSHYALPCSSRLLFYCPLSSSFPRLPLCLPPLVCLLPPLVSAATIATSLATAARCQPIPLPISTLKILFR